jgi:peptidoglycan/xylan/chitin deacetylase (PgdA/CDA1 family)
MLKFRITNIIFAGISVSLLALFLLGYEYSWILLVAALIVYLLIVFGGVVNVKWQFFMPIICRLPNPDNSIFLSFDDGPHENTAEILNLLRKHKAKGNFFCTGRHLDENPQLAQQLVEEGHFMGNHSYSHTAFFPTKPTNSIVEELQHTNEAIEKYTGEPCRFFRPPFGVTNPHIAKAVETLNMTCIGWSIRSYDTRDREGSRALNNIKRNLKSGDIVLLHDHSPQIRSVLEELLCFLKEHNFSNQRIDTIFEKNKL